VAALCGEDHRGEVPCNDGIDLSERNAVAFEPVGADLTHGVIVEEDDTIGGLRQVREGEEGVVVLHGDLPAAERAHDAVDGGRHAKIL
jgi:hypothetical protein